MFPASDPACTATTTEPRADYGHEARRRGCGLVQLTTDKSRPDAHRFYHQLGFVASHEGMKLRL